MCPSHFIKFLDLKKINDAFEPSLQHVIARVLDSGVYLFGEEVEGFEKEYGHYIGTNHCITVGNGLDALSLIIRAYKSIGQFRNGDEIIVPANTFIASLLAIVNNGLKPVLVDPDIPSFNISQNEIKKKMTSRTKAIMLVHLYGRNAFQEEILHLAKDNNLKIIEDNAQAAGCEYLHQKTGSLGHAAAHSFYPAKNLAALGDGGAVTTDDANLAYLIRAMANYGATEKNHFPYQGMNSRMDEIQAAVLRVKLMHLDHDNQVRRQMAKIYHAHIHHPKITLPLEMEIKENRSHIWHLFTILHPKRDLLSIKLRKVGIQTQIHYPIAPHHQPAFSAFSQLRLPNSERIHKETLSLPLYPVLGQENIHYIAEQVNLHA